MLPRWGRKFFKNGLWIFWLKRAHTFSSIYSFEILNFYKTEREECVLDRIFFNKENKYISFPFLFFFNKSQILKLLTLGYSYFIFKNNDFEGLFSVAERLKVLKVCFGPQKWRSKLCSVWVIYFFTLKGSICTLSLNSVL